MSAPGRLPRHHPLATAARARTAPAALVLALAASCWLLVALTVHLGSQTLAISEQQAILDASLKGALTDLARDPKIGPDAVRQFRALCVGSWCCGKASPLSDLDITFDHPDRQIAERVTNSVKERVEAAMKAKGGSHNIKVAFAGDPNFKEFFTGDTGQAFIHEYALRNSPGGRATYTPVIKDGAVEFEMRSASEFWTGVGRPVPKKFTSVSTFVDESAAMLKAARTGNALEDAFKAAKYLNNVETIIKPGFSATYGVALPPSLQINETTRYQMQEIMRLKGDTSLTSAEKETRLRTILGAEDAAQLEKKLGDFVAKGEEYFKGTSQRIAFFEDVVKSGGLRNAANAADALSVAEKLVETIKRYPAGAAFGALDVGLLVHHYARYGADRAFYEQLALSGAMYGMPPAAITAMVGTVAKEVFRAAGEYAVSAFIFDAINDAMIRSAYNPENAWYLFSTDLGGNPFRGYSRATLACKYMGNKSLKGDPALSEMEPLLADDVDKYVSALSAWRGLSGFTFGEMGPADIRDRLLPYLMADLRKSRDAWQAMGARETNLYTNATAMFPAKPAVAIWVNGVQLEQRTHPAFTFDAAPGKPISVVVDVRREFARAVYRAVTPPGSVQAKWCQCNGDWNSYLQWEKATLKEQESFEIAPSPVHVGLSGRGLPGWQVSTTLPLPRLDASKESASAEQDMATGSDSGRQQFSIGTYRVAVTVTDKAKAPVSLDFGFRLKDAFQSVDESFAFTIVVRPPKPAVSEPDLAGALEKAIEKVNKEKKAEPEKKVEPARTSEKEKAGAVALPPEFETIRKAEPKAWECARSSYDYYQQAVERSKNPGHWQDGSAISWFNCGIGADWQMHAGQQCCEEFDRNRKQAGAWEAFQQCGWAREIKSRKESLDKAIASCRTRYGNK